MITVLLALSGIVLSTIFLVRQKTLRFVSCAICGMVLYFCLDALLFNNAYAFRIYARCLKQWNIGWRQASTLARESERYQKDVKQTDYVAVGSSQTFATYTMYARANIDLSIFNVAGMNILDIILFRNEIENSCGGHILLMLSDFDLCSKPWAAGARIDPPQSLKTIIRLVPKLYRNGLMSFNEIQDYLLAQIFRGYKYQYVCRGLLDKAGRKNAAFPKTGAHDLGGDNAGEAMIGQLRQLNTRWLQANLQLVKEFLDWASEAGFAVTIIEGVYDPEIMQENREMRETVRQALSDLCVRIPNVTYYPIQSFTCYDQLQYSDPFHLDRQSGDMLAQEIIRHIRE